jgi:hypothetical protein
MTTDSGRVGKADQALAVPATPLRVDGPSGFDPSRLRALAVSIEAMRPDFAPVALRGAFEAIHGEKPERVPGGSHALDEWLRRFNPFYRFVNAGAFLSAAKSLLDIRALWAVGEMEEGPFARVCWPMPCGGYFGGYVEGQGVTGAMSLIAAVLRGHAIAIEARQRTDPEEGLDPKGESAGRKASPETSRGGES